MKTVQNMRHFLSALIGSFTLLLSINTPLSQAEVRLPHLGGSNDIISPQKEFELGQKWLKYYRSRVDTTTSDPLLIAYIEKLLDKLLPHSEVLDPRLSVIVVDNPTLNAFAVPGGIIGVHTGLLTHTKSEDQLAAVLAHELAHLSQRHYARRLEQQKANTLPAMAGVLAGLILAATTGTDAGLAALTASQAASLQTSLRFSRQHESEADRLGMETLARAGLNPHAAADMFEQMLRNNRYSRRPPEFLLTHPITENRINDARNFGHKYPRSARPSSLTYYLMRARVEFQQTRNTSAAVKKFDSEIQGDSLSREASRYGLVLALTADKKYTRAKTILRQLLQRYPDESALQIAEIDLALAQEEHDKAIALLRTHLKRQPQAMVYNIRLAESYLAAGRAPQAVTLLREFRNQRPQDDYLWYLLAEAEGLAGNTTALHYARAEYYVLNGNFDKALLHLKLAVQHSRQQPVERRLKAIINERLQQVLAMQREAHRQ